MRLRDTIRNQRARHALAFFGGRTALNEQTKETLLDRASGLRGLVGRARRLATKLPSDAERHRLLRHAEELEEQALRFEQDAADY